MTLSQFAGTLAIQRFDRTDALHDGRVTLERMMVSHVLPGVSVTGLLNGTFEAAEIPLAHLAWLRDRAEPFTAIPVFPDRIFVQPYVYVRRGSGITSLADLRGRRVSVPMYFMTSSIWHRALLREAGVAASEVQWVVSAVERDPRMVPPAGVEVQVRPRDHLSLEPLLSGAVDCVMTEGRPIADDPAGDVVPLDPDWAGSVLGFFRERQQHPIVHVIAVQEAFGDRNPDVLLDLVRGFDQAKQCAYDRLQNERLTGLPLMRAHLEQTVDVFGADPWPYGLSGRNEGELRAFLRYAREDGFLERELAPADLFHPAVADHEGRAQMRPGADLGSPQSLLGRPRD